MKHPSYSNLILYLHASAAFQLFYAGVELGVLEALYQKKSLTTKSLMHITHLKAQPIRCLLFGLTALGLINKQGEKYSNAVIIEEFFKRNEWELLKSMVLIQAHIMYIGQTDFLESLKQNTNIGVLRFHGKGETLYKRLRKNPKLKKMFYNYMETYSAYAIKFLLQKINFDSDYKILDVGGGGGKNAIEIAKKYPKIKVTLVELPVAQSLAQKNIKDNHLEEQISFYPCDMFKEAFPKNQDAVLFIHQLVIWSREQNKKLLQKAYNSLKSGGRVIIFSSISEDDEQGPLMAALDTVYFRAVAAGRGMIYPWKDYEKLLSEIGFSKIKRIRASTWTPHGIVVGYK